jgi:DNA-binding FrmR family transcriptional regulator
MSPTKTARVPAAAPRRATGRGLGRRPGKTLPGVPGRTGYLTPEAKRRLTHRINRVMGHLGSIGRMVEEERCAVDLLVQVAAARSAVGQIAAKILEEHLAECMGSCMEGTPEKLTRRVSRAVATVLRNS